MGNSKIKWIDDKTLKISGIIDETFSLEEHLKLFTDGLRIDLGGVTRINSCGVREWIRAVIGLKVRVHLIKCPTVIVNQISMISEFLGMNGVVDSFEVVEVCEHCDYEQSKFVDLEKISDINELKSLLEPCPKCDKDMVFDQDFEVYEDLFNRMKAKNKGAA